MNLAALLQELRRRGVEVARDGGFLRYRAPFGALTPALRAALVELKGELLEALGGESLSQNSRYSQNPLGINDSANCANIAKAGTPSEDTAAVFVSGKEFRYLRSWAGRTLAGEAVAFDTETTLIDGVGVPTLALASASSGGEHCLIHPDRVGAFVLAHRDRNLVFQNIAFDFWVVVKHLVDCGETEALRLWWEIADGGRMHDAMILDMLVRLARHDAYPRPRDLGVIGREYAGLEVSKEDPYRLRYGEIVGKDWSSVEEGFFSYAVKDAIVTWHAHAELRRLAERIAAENGVRPEAVLRYGPLSETVQIKGAIALAQVSRNGMHLDLARSSAVREGYRAELSRIVARLREMPECAGLFKTRKRTGELVVTRHGTPSLSQKVLRQVLTGIASAAAKESGQTIAVPTTAKGAVSVSTREWADFAHLHPFIKGWTDLSDTAKLCQFFGGLRAPVIHPRYGIMVRSGRSCASGPNIQQIPRKGGLREIFIPSPGSVLPTEVRRERGEGR